MLTPGQSSIDPRLRRNGTPLVGHMDPWFKEECYGREHKSFMLRARFFQTENR